MLPLSNVGGVLAVDAGGTLSNNTYNWYKDGILITTIEGDNTYMPQEEGNYHCEVSNSIVTNYEVSEAQGQTLVLVSDTIEYLLDLCLHQDYPALVALYIATNGENWTNNMGWDTTNTSSCTPCDWYGVTCNEAGRVIYLQLGNNNLTGNIPTELGQLDSLTHLQLFGNNLMDTLPTTLGELSQLEDLNLYNNDLTGHIPTTLGNLTNLTKLHLGTNELTGSVPSELGNLVNLTLLWLHINDLTGSIPANLGNLTNLNDLRLDQNDFTGCFAPELMSLCNVPNVSFSNNSGLPNGGDFDAFCASETSDCIPITYVNQLATGQNNGTSWTDAYTNLQTATSTTTDGEIWVAAGTYLPTQTTDRSLSFEIARNVSLFGGFPNIGNPAMEDRNWDEYPTMLSGDIGILGDTIDNTFHVLTINANFTTDDIDVMDGFIIADGNSDYAGGGAEVKGNFTFRNCLFTDNFAGYEGGAITGNNIMLTIENCIFENNYADHSGGAVNYYGPTPIRQLHILNSVFNKNKAKLVGGAVNGTGFNNIVSCLFVENTTNNNGGAIAHSEKDSLIITNCTFTLNTGQLRGAAISDFSRDSTFTQITNSVFYKNQADNNQLFDFSGSAIHHANIAYSFIDSTECPTGISCGEGMIFDKNSPFVDAAMRNFTPDKDGLLVDNGNNSFLVPALLHDLAGNPRISGSTIDIGAYETETISCLDTMIIYVDVAATGNNNGTSWADAFTDLQEAIDFGRDCNNMEIWVAKGSYLPSKDKEGNSNPTDSRAKTFYIDYDVKIYGGFTGTETLLSERDHQTNLTILSGDFNEDDVPVEDKSDENFPAQNNGENTYTVVHTFEVSSNCLLDGLQISGGYANEFLNADNYPMATGGGLLNEVANVDSQSNVLITNCVFSYNYARRGGAFSNRNNGGISNPIFTNCSFYANSAGGFGGVFYNHSAASGDSSPSFNDCKFQNNNSNFIAGVAYLNGSNSNPTFTNCAFSDNDGGVIYNTFSASPTFQKCVFLNNTGNSSNAGAINNATGHPQIIDCSFIGNSSSGDGGAIVNSASAATPSNPEIINCIFANNTASNRGGAIYDGLSNAIITNCTFYNNRTLGTGVSFFGGGALCLSGTNPGDFQPIVTNCVFEDNKIGNQNNIEGADIFISRVGTDTNSNAYLLTYCLTQENSIHASGEGIINNQDPLFTNATASDLNIDLTLQTGSPAIDAGNKEALAETGILLDLAGNPRINNCEIDMGAYENQAISENDCEDMLCTIGTLEVNGNPNSNNEISSDTYQATEAITSTGIVSSGNDVTLKAGESITLSPGFHAEAGAIFSAFIATCEPVIQRVFNDEIEETPVVTSSVPTKEVAKAPIFEVYPNPFFGQTNLKVYLPQDDLVSIQVFDQAGRMVAQPWKQQEMSAGDYQLILNTEELLGGMFYVILQNSTERIVKKIIILDNYNSSFRRDD